MRKFARHGSVLSHSGSMNACATVQTSVVSLRTRSFAGRRVVCAPAARVAAQRTVTMALTQVRYRQGIRLPAAVSRCLVPLWRIDMLRE